MSEPGEAAVVVDYIFGYGSILNAESRRSTGGPARIAVAQLRQLPGIGTVGLAWNFQSATGFTALGLEPAAADPAPPPVRGVLFPADRHMDAFDSREDGYRRVRVPAAELHLCDAPAAGSAEVLQPAEEVASLRRRLDAEEARAWTYVPLPECVSQPDKEHPICQTYVDTVLGGCLDVGGEDMATALLLGTSGWSEFFLNDVPMSRRPWLHRPANYATIDRLLEKHSELTRFDMRRHPEEFGAHVSMATRGMWNVPRRNKLFVGRERELSELHSKMHAEDAELTSGVTALGTVGLGGVGKTQIAIEYCYRNYQRVYGLVCWLNAESAESLAADFRKLATDFKVEVGDKKNEEVVEEVKACFYACRQPWLLVFDNVESPGVVRSYLPRGGVGKFGHVLITSRRMTDEWRGRCLVLDCFNAEESVAFLRRAVPRSGSGSPSGSEESEIESLAESLGYLPLALSMAASYMHRCDVTFADYAARYNKRRTMLGQEHGTMDGDYPLTVAGSLTLSLERMAKESMAALCVLDTLSFMAPDGISKPLIQLLLQQVQTPPTVSPSAGEDPNAAAPSMARAIKTRPKRSAAFLCAAWMSSTVACAAVTAVLVRAFKRNVQLLWLLVGSSCVGVGAATLTNRFLPPPCTAAAEPAPEPAPSVSVSSTRDDGQTDPDFRHSHLEDEADRIWGLMKSYSLFVVRQGTASMHRLLQQVVRSRQKDARVALGRAVWALQELWCFEPGDTSTWQDAGLVEHVKTVGRFCGEYKVDRPQASKLLTEAAIFISMTMSSFDVARKLLEQALEMQHGVHGDSPHGDTARTMYELGRVLRYCGTLDMAQDMLSRAHAMQGRIWAGERMEIAMTLHEMGVLAYKQQDLEQARSRLQQSLEMKRRLSGISGSDDRMRENQRREEAVTLHHLAQVYVASKPPRLDEAEALLQTALRLEGKAAFSRAGARGATLQQLGRVSIRRGHLDQARRYLLQALELHESAYGSQQHVNCATDHHQLGLLEMNRRRHSEAAEHMNSALRIRRSIYLRGEHVDVAVDLTQLGKIERARGNLDAAQQYLEEASELLGSLPQEQRCMKETTRVLEWMGTVARDRGDKEGARRYLKQQQVICEQHGIASAGLPPRDPAVPEHACDASPQPTPPLQSQLLRSREIVRTELVAASKAKRPIALDTIHEAGESVALMAAQLRSDDSQADAQQRLVAMADGFSSQLRDWRSQTEADPQTPRSERALLFGACDDVRQQLQELGVKVEDR